MSSQSKDRRQDAGHFEYKVGQILGKKYKVLSHLGDGTFGRALLCEDTVRKTKLAVKVVRAVDRYTHSAKIEANILFDIKKQGGY